MVPVSESPLAAAEGERGQILVPRQAALGSSDGDGRAEALVPPRNFGVIDQCIYRSGFPNADNLPFLKNLNLKSVLCLCPNPYPEEIEEFLRSQGIRLFQCGIQGSREAFATVHNNTIHDALGVLLDVRNHPILVHCNRGKHRTGSVVGCFRKLQNWCLSSVLEEYVKFASVKARPTDMKFIEMFDASRLMHCILGIIIYRYHGFGSRSRRIAWKIL